MSTSQDQALDVARKATSFTPKEQDDAINCLLDIEREAVATLDAVEKARAALAVARDPSVGPTVFVWTLRLTVPSANVASGFDPSTTTYLTAHLTASNLARLLAEHDASGHMTIVTSPEPSSIERAQRATNPLEPKS